MPVEDALGSPPASRCGAELGTALLTAADASAIALVAFPGGDPQRPGRRRRNGPHDVVTRTDAAVERQIRSILLSRFPDDGFIGEETSPRRPRETGRSQRSWIVDPIDGTKNFCTNAPVASTFVIMAVTDPNLGNKGISAFIVERDNPGLKVGKIEDKLGVRASGTAQVLLTECEVPWDALLGEENRGFVNALRILDNGRIGIGAMAVGLAQGAFEEAVTYAKGRIQFDKPIAEHQAIQFMLADMAMRVEAARSLVHRAAWLKDKGRPFKREAAMAKLYASEASSFVTNKAIQIHGGYGYIKDYPV